MQPFEQRIARNTALNGVDCQKLNSEEPAEEEAVTADELPVAVQTLAGLGALMLFAPVKPSDSVRLLVLP